MQVPMFAVPVRRWECPNCDTTDVTREVEPYTRFHNCPGLAGLTAPMVPAGSKARVRANEREDYIAGEDVRVDANGRPVMSITTEHPDGRTDCVVFAPTAHAASKNQE
jgi:hypothetical protein